MQDLTVKNNYIDVINEFRSLIDFINYDEVLYEKMFQIISNHFEFEATGIFFNSPDSLKINTLELYLKNTNLNSKDIETKFFSNMSEYKQIINHETKIHYYQRNTAKTKIENELTIPFMFNEKLLGGICIQSSDEVLKDSIEVFNFIIKEFLTIFKLKYIYSEQIFNSSVDSLTGLYNRNQFNIGLEHEFNRAKRYNTPFSVAMIDIDHFKNINDNFGHQFGDYVLKEIAQLIQHAFRKTDIVYRYGGEEIVIIMPETDSNHAYLPLERLREKISRHDFKSQKVTISIGIGDYRENISANDILKQADKMLYKAKNDGRNRVVSN